MIFLYNIHNKKNEIEARKLGKYLHNIYVVENKLFYII